ncbi:MAG: glycogen-binding domain-containing protein [Bacteroidia bacterium]
MKQYIIWLSLVLFNLSSTAILAQKPPVFKADVYSCNADETIVSLPRKLDGRALDSLIELFALEDLELHYLYEYGKLEQSVAAAGWHLSRFDKHQIELRKPNIILDEGTEIPFSKTESWENRLMLADYFVKNNFNTDQFYPTASYGINRFKDNFNPIKHQNRVRLVLKGHEQARQVYISGSFNSWSTGNTPMLRDADGWYFESDLPPGKHLYKFIVDGKWLSDPLNLQQERDGFRGHNSVLFVYNKRMVFDALPDARRVWLVGSFNQWNEKELPMVRAKGKWELELYLAEGTHAYKFKADKKWYLDPENPIVLADRDGYENSYLSIGDTLFFELKGFSLAHDVFVAGNFNLWNPIELRMRKTDSSWIMPYVLGAGVYAYKFIVDGQWMADPEASFFAGTEPYRNSILIVKPNVMIKLNGHEFAREVIWAGSFNDWEPESLRLSFQGDGWYLPYFLKPGKHTYKFKIDGEWVRDPDNPLWEQNEFGTGNSVLWIK